MTEENRLPEAILVIPNPMPRTNNGGISPKLKWANAKIKAETRCQKLLQNLLKELVVKYREI